MALAATPALSTFYGMEATNLLQAPNFSGNPSYMLNDAGPLSLGYGFSSGGSSLYNYGDNAALAVSWDAYLTRDCSNFNPPNTLSQSLSFSDSSVYSTDESDLFMSNNSDELFQLINECNLLSAGSSVSTIHPNLVSTLKNMVSPGLVGSCISQGDMTCHNAQAAVLDQLALTQTWMEQHQQEQLQHDNIDSLRSALMRHSQPQVMVPKVELHDFTSTVGAMVPMATISDLKPQKADEKSETEDSIEAAVVSLDLIKNRRPFRCQHEGCNKTFKNPQTMKMHHKTHYSDGSAASKACMLPTLSSSLKAGHNKKIPSRCPKCKKTFVGLYELRRHYGRKHSEGEKPFGCRKCGKKFYIEVLKNLLILLSVAVFCHVHPLPSLQAIRANDADVTKVDVRDHEKLCGEPIECKCGLKFAFKCNLVAHKKAHPACQDHLLNNSNSTTSNNQSSYSDDSEQSPCSLRSSPRSGTKRAREPASPIQSSLHVPLPDFEGIPEAPAFKMARHDLAWMSFPTDTSLLCASNVNYPPISFTNLPLSSRYPNQGDSQEHFSSKVHPISSTYPEAVNCEMGIVSTNSPLRHGPADVASLPSAPTKSATPWANFFYSFSHEAVSV
uniref:C2H2-type domain-containing protein n=1 Tax=Physcomitrium patens TaxID=3218 RepID=A0A7I4BG63_PHYPA